MGQTLQMYRAKMQAGFALGLSPTKTPEQWKMRCDNLSLEVFKAVYGRHCAVTVYAHLLEIMAILRRVQAEVVEEAAAAPMELATGGPQITRNGEVHEATA